MTGPRDRCGEPGRGRADRRLEAGYRRLLALYPARHRRVHREEMLAVLLTAARPGQRRPGLAEALDLVAGAVRIRCQPASKGEPAWRRLLAGRTARRRIIVIAFAVSGLAVGIAVVKPQPYSSRDAVILGPATQASDDALIATSRPVLANAGRSLHLREGFAFLRPRVSATAQTRRVIQITAQGASPVAALRTDQAITHAYLRFHATLRRDMYREITRAYRRHYPTSDFRALQARLRARYATPIQDTAVLREPHLLPHTSLLAAGIKSGGIGLAAGLLGASLIVLIGTTRKPNHAS